MSLPIGERRRLRAMERATASADPGLADRFAIFNRLSHPEGRPRTERVKAREIRRKKWAERAIAEYLLWGPDVLLERCRDGARGGNTMANRFARRLPLRHPAENAMFILTAMLNFAVLRVLTGFLAAPHLQEVA